MDASTFALNMAIYYVDKLCDWWVSALGFLPKPLPLMLTSEVVVGSLL